MLRSLSLVVALGALVGCVQALPEQQPPTSQALSVSASEWRTTETVLVLTDASYSMYENETFPQAKALTQAIVANLPSAEAKAEHPGMYQVGTMGFGGDARSGAAIGTYDREVLEIAAGELNLMGFPLPNTPLHDVLDESAAALASLENPGRTAVILLSDGNPNSEAQAMSAGQALVEAVPGGVCLHTVHLGNDPDGAAFLKALSDQSKCGSTRAASTLTSASGVDGFTRTVMVGPAPVPAKPLPPVGAKDACKDKIDLGSLNFEFDSDAISDDGAAVLNVAVKQLGTCQNVKVTINGHTDWTGPEEYNMGLSERRAQSVRSYFVENGIESSRLTTVPHGEDAPIASNETRSGRAQNRRVELDPRN